MRRLALIALALALAAAFAAACDDGGPALPTAEGPTSLALTKTMVETGDGGFRFTLTLTNTGENAAVNVSMSDVWNEGLKVESIGSVEGQQPKGIGDFGLEVIFQEFAAGKTVELVYTARCVQKGEWINAAAAGATNAEPSETAVTVACP